LRSQTLLQ
jgi:hypothetical protein